MTTLNPYAEYEAATKRIAKKTHSVADEALVMTWEIGLKLVNENKRLMAESVANMTRMQALQAQVRQLTARNDILESRGQPNMTLKSMLSTAQPMISQAGEK